jgi:hypothetical protein
MHLKVFSSKTDPTWQSHEVLLAFGVDPAGQSLQTFVTLAVPLLQTQPLPFHYWLTPHLLTHTWPNLI